LVRTENVTMLYVNEINSSVPVGYSLLINYTSKPWINPELGESTYKYIYMVYTQCFKNWYTNYKCNRYIVVYYAFHFYLSMFIDCF